MADNGHKLLGPGTTAALEKYGASVAQNLAVARRHERGTIEAVTRLDNQRVVSAEVRVGAQTYTVPWSGAGARVGDVVEVSRGLGSAAAPDYRFERFVDSLVAYVYADDDATIPAPTWTGMVLTATMLINPAQQGAQVTLYIKETAEAYGPAATEVRWRRSGVGANWRSMAVPNVGAVDAVLTLILPELLEPEVSYDFQTRTRTISGSVSPYGTTLTQTILPGFTTPTQPLPFTLVPPGPPAIPYLDTSANLELVIHYPPPSQTTTFDYWHTELALAPGGPVSVTLTHFGSTGTYKVTTPTTYYIRYREVSKYTSAGVPVVSPWMPGSGYAGPLILGVAPERDVTPPNVPTDLTVPVNSYAVVGGATVHLVSVIWNGQNGSPTTYTYTSDFETFEVFFENLTNAHNSLLQKTGRDAVFTATNVLRPTHSYRVNVRAVDKLGNATAWVVGPTITVAAPVAPTGGTTVVIDRIGYNAVALKITYAPISAEAPPIGFNLYSAPNGYPAAERDHGFVAAQVATAAGGVSTFTVINPVSPDPPSWVGMPAGQKLRGTTWAFRAVPVSSAGNPGLTSAWVPGVFTEIDGANLIVGSVTARELNAAIVLAAQYIKLGAGALFRSNADEVRIDETGIDISDVANNSKEALSFYAGPGVKQNWRASIYASTGPSPEADGSPLTGLTVRAEDGLLQGQSVYQPDEGWVLTPAGVKFYTTLWPLGAKYDRYYSRDGIYETNGVGLGVFKVIPTSYMSFASLSANTDWIVAASSFVPAIPTSAGYTGFNVKGFVNAPAGSRVYVYPGGGWGLDAGGSFLVPASGSLEWGPCVIPCVWGYAQFYIRCTGAMSSGGIWMSGYFR